MQKLSDFPQPYHELYAVHQMFCQLGFPSDDLHVSLSPEVNLGPNLLCLHLRSQGKEFIATVARMGEDAVEKEVLGTWTAFAEMVLDPERCPTEDLRRSLESSQVGYNPQLILSFMDTLLNRGFHIPALPGEQHIAVFRNILQVAT